MKIKRFFASRRLGLSQEDGQPLSPVHQIWGAAPTSGSEGCTHGAADHDSRLLPTDLTGGAQPVSRLDTPLGNGVQIDLE